ncbi:unnamed protein product [Blepharisma stoltei]|uniref:Uncharacterized protein n=1 Tax=Blepharisma stoltei TaxID=1481888 RepID=A0AAU9J0D9_9CILI|nr:unnamed protein product [Blepharisma stoltei]
MQKDNSACEIKRASHVESSFHTWKRFHMQVAMFKNKQLTIVIKNWEDVPNEVVIRGFETIWRYEINHPSALVINLGLKTQ